MTFIAEDPAVDYNVSSESDAQSDTASRVVEPHLGRRHSDNWQASVFTMREQVTNSMPAPSPMEERSQGRQPNANAASSGVYDGSVEQLPPDVSTPESHDFRLSNNIDFILNPYTTGFDPVAYRHSRTASASGHIPSELYAESPESTMSRGSKGPRQVETDPEVAYLLRYFSEVPGKWYVTEGFRATLGVTIC